MYVHSFLREINTCPAFILDVIATSSGLPTVLGHGDTV